MALLRKKHIHPPAGYIEGQTVNNRTWTLHPRKGWRSRAVVPESNETLFSGPMAWYRQAMRKRGLLSYGEMKYQVGGK